MKDKTLEYRVDKLEQSHGCLESKVDEIRTDQLPEIRQELKLITETLKDMSQSFEDVKKNYVRKENYKLVESLVFGFSAIILVSVIGGLVALVVQK